MDGGKIVLDALKTCRQKELIASPLDASASLPIVKQAQESKINAGAYAQLIEECKRSTTRY